MAEYGLMDIMPENLLADNNIRNIVEVIDERLKDSYKQTAYPAIISRIDELDSDILDSLAWQYNVDFYDPAINVENKRKLIRESIAWHRLKGTSAAVNQLVSAIFGPSSVQEWYEYGGEPYHFRITSSGFDPAGKTQKLFAHEMIFRFYSERDFELILLLLLYMHFSQAFVSFQNFEVPEVYEVYRLL